MWMLTLQDLRQQVQALQPALDAAAADDPFGSADWLLAFIEHVLPGDWVGVALAAAGGACPLWLARPTRRAGPYAALANYYTGLLDAQAHAALGVASTAREARLPVVHLSPLARDTADRLAGVWRGAGWWVDVRPAFGNWHLPSEGLTFDDYMAARPEALRNTWRRKRRRFERGEHGARLEIVSRPEDVAAGMDAFETVYRASWKPPESHPAFVRAWAQACARRGWLRLGIAWMGDVPVAAQFWFTCGGRAHIFKLAYDHRHRTLSAGTVLSAHLLRHALDVDHVAEVDYLSGDDTYKRDWMTHRRQRVQMLACNPATMAGWLAAARLLAGRLRAMTTARPMTAAHAAKVVPRS